MKTNYLRHLITNCPAKYVLINNNLMQSLSDPAFIDFVANNTKSVFILEDCEQVLQNRSHNMFNSAISNILNMSDGLMSDIFNLKFICTFNASLVDIDSALLRKGRCHCKYEFKELSKEKVENLKKIYNLEIDVIKPMTLSDIFNYESDMYEEITSDRKKLGFR